MFLICNSIFNFFVFVWENKKKKKKENNSYSSWNTMAVQQEMEKEMKLFEFFFFFFFNRKQIKDSKLEDALKVKSWKKKNGITKLDINNTTFISSFLIYSAPAETKKK